MPRDKRAVTVPTAYHAVTVNDLLTASYRAAYIPSKQITFLASTPTCPTMHFPRLSKPSPLQSMKHYQPISSPISPTSDESASSDESHLLQPAHQPHYFPGAPNLLQCQLVVPVWATSMRSLLYERATPANRLEEQHTLAAPITSEKRHRELMEWSARVASTERELRSIMQDLKAEGVGFEDVLLAIQEEQDYLVVERLWMN